MKLSQLSQFVQQYDEEHLPQADLFIQLLKVFTQEQKLHPHKKALEATIPFFDYQTFLKEKGYNVDVFESYLTQGSAGAVFFNTWRSESLQALLSKHFEWGESLKESLEEQAESLSNSIAKYKCELTTQNPPKLNLNISPSNINFSEALHQQQQERWVNLEASYQSQSSSFGSLFNCIDSKMADAFKNMRFDSQTFFKAPSAFMETETRFTATQTQQLQFRNMARIRRAARGLAQAHRDNTSFFSRLPKHFCVELAAQCSDGSISKEQAIEYANQCFGKPQLSLK